MVKGLKILQFMASERFGGAEKVFVDLSFQLSNTHSVTALVLRKTEYLEKFSKSVKIVELKSHPTRHNPFLLYEIYKKILKIKPDIVHTHGSKAAELVSRAAFFTRINHLATKHNARRGRVFNTLPYVSAVSRQGMLSIIPKRKQVIRLINNGIVSQPVNKNIKDIPFTIAAVGRLDKIKGFDILLDQLAMVRFPFRLIIAGEGQERSKLEKKIIDLGLQHQVNLIGFCADIPNLMASSHLVVITSHSEGFPLVMVEALFYGNVLISTAVGGVTEVLTPFFLTKHEDLSSKLVDVFQNYSNYKKQFESIKKNKAGDYTLAEIASKYEAFYDEILS